MKQLAQMDWQNISPLKTKKPVIAITGFFNDEKT